MNGTASRAALMADECQRIDAWVGAGWEAFRGARILITGGTGFVGTWLVSSIALANQRHGLDIRLAVLSRDPCGFLVRAPWLAGLPGLELVVGDIGHGDLPDGPFSHVVHGAAAASAQLNREQPLVMIDTIVVGTRRILQHARNCGATRLLHLSSGAVYGRQPAGLAGFPENHAGGPDQLDPGNAYHEAKRLAEQLCAISRRDHPQLGLVVARLFAFVGPLLPLDAHFAVGNFLRDGLAGRPIEIGGDGTAVRSYLYAADMAAWLWRLLADGPVRSAVNVGSPDALSIGALAEAVSQSAGGGLAIRIAGRPGVPGDRYVPDTTQAQALGLRVWTPVNEALERTLRWHRAADGGSHARC